MIRRLRRRMLLMVIGVLVLVSVGLVLAIYLANGRSIAARSEAMLAVLAANRGEREAIAGDENTQDGEDGASRPQWPEGEQETARDGSSRRGSRGQPPDLLSGAAAARLSNSYTITLNEDGTVASWTSDRPNLYSDEQVASMTADVLAEGNDHGRIGTQFYRRTESGGKSLLIVLDARMEYLVAANGLKTTALSAAGACLLLSLLAWLMIRRMVKPVEVAFTRQKQFVSDASHELKTPLAVISANAEVLEQEIGENEYLGYIRSEVRRTDSLVRNLLTLARMDQGRTKAAMKEFDLSRAVLDVALPFESTVYEAGKTLDMEIPDGIDCVGDEEMIKQLAVILLSNALKYSDEHGVIRISLAARGKQRELRVFNTGNPISKEDQEHIFDRFWRADAAHGRETGGHGLGLAIAKTIVEAHRGKITVESREGEGTTFLVTI